MHRESMALPSRRQLTWFGSTPRTADPNEALQEVLARQAAQGNPLLIIYLSAEWESVGRRVPNPEFLSAWLVQALRPCDQIICLGPETFLLVFPGATAGDAAETVQQLASDLSLVAPDLSLPRTELPFALSVLRGPLEAQEARELVQEAAAHARLGPIAIGGLAVEPSGFKPCVPVTSGLNVTLAAHSAPTVNCQALFTRVSSDGMVLETSHPLMPLLVRRLLRMECELPCDQLRWTSILQPLPGGSRYLAPWPRRIDQVPRRRSFRHKVVLSLEFGGSSGHTVNIGEGGFLAVVPTGAAVGVEFRAGRLLLPTGDGLPFIVQIVRNLPYRQPGHRLISARFVKLDPSDQARLSHFLQPLGR